MEMKKLLVGALAATALTVGGGAAMAAGQAPEATADVTRQEEQEPSYKGSLQAPADKEVQNEVAEGKEGPENEAAEDQQEAAEAQQLQGLAKVDQKAAEEAAIQAVPGTAKDAELGNENGYVVWEVEVAGDDGTLHEVKVDAGNGKVLAQEAEEDEGSEQGEADEGPEGSEADEPAEASGQ